MARSPRHFQRILICRTDNIGDVVLTLPLAGYLKTHFPHVQVDMLCRPYAAPLVRHCRFIDRVLAPEAGDDLEQLLTHGNYDTVIFAFPDRRLARAAKRARIRNRVGTSHRLFHLFTCNKLVHFSRARSTLHEAQLNFALLRPLGIDVRPSLQELPAYYGLSALHNKAVSVLREREGCYFILHTKSNNNGREWPLRHYTRLARDFVTHPDIHFWVTGSAAEGLLLQEQAPELLALPNVSNLCGKFDLDGLTALIGASDGLVASGTGPLHMSAALGRPTLGLFPPLNPIDPARWGALGKRARNLCRPQACSGCPGAADCACMRALTPDMVRQVLLEWAEKQGSTAPAYDRAGCRHGIFRLAPVFSSTTDNQLL
jgi:ADP-heptose:LPS heptosyltransferase